jgi:hypothetical protein
MTHRNAEKSFWQDVLSSTSPDWTIKLSNTVDLDQGLSGLTTYIYAIDTSTGWIASGAMRPQDLATAFKKASASELNKTEIADTAGQAVLQAGRDAASADSEATRQSVLAAAHAITLTQTYQTALPTGLDGHWIFMVYRGADQSSLTRPVFTRQRIQGMLPPESLRQIVRQVAQTDTTNRNGQVYQIIQKIGGVLLDEQFTAAPSAPPAPRPR